MQTLFVCLILLALTPVITFVVIVAFWTAFAVIYILIGLALWATFWSIYWVARLFGLDPIEPGGLEKILP